MTDPYYADDAVTLYHGDCIEVMRSLPDNSVDAVVTDPPYGLEFMGKEWDRPWAVSPTQGVGFAGREDNLTLPSFGDNRNANCRACGGRQRGNKRCTCATPDWDRKPGSDMAEFQAWCLTWTTELYRVLKPGGHLLAFGGTRTWHRLACAIEDAGFEVRDSIAWMYGSGFPKSLDVSKAIDRAGGDTGQRVFRTELRYAIESSGLSFADIDNALGVKSTSCYWVRTDHRACLPAPHHWEKLSELLELSEDLAALYVECERTDREVRPGAASGSLSGPSVKVVNPGTPQSNAARQWQGWGTALKPAFEPIVVARKPLVGTVAANVLEHGTGALNIDGCRIGYASDADERESKDKNRNADFGAESGGNQVYGDFSMVPRVNYNPPGRWPANVILDESQATELDRQSGVQRDGVAVNRNRNADEQASWYGTRKSQTGADVTYGGEGGASRFFYTAKADSSERPRVDGVAHPTVKPLDLMRYLVRLVTPPGGVVLEPFAGSGTTAEACIVEGFGCIAIERESDYLPLILHRITKPIEVTLL